MTTRTTEHMGLFGETFWKFRTAPLRSDAQYCTRSKHNSATRIAIFFIKDICCKLLHKDPTSNAEIFSRPRSSLSRNFVALDGCGRHSRRTKYSPPRHRRAHLPDCLC